MRKLTCFLFITLDGVVESPENWSFDHFDDDMMQAMISQISAQDAVLLGRKTYQEWADYWPTSTDEPFASFINNIAKYVVSNTLGDDLTWAGTTRLNGDLVASITQLKQSTGQNIGTSGSPTLVHGLLKHGLLDELILAVHPVVAGRGQRLFPDGEGLQRLQLIEGKTTSSGVALLTYGLRPEA